MKKYETPDLKVIYFETEDIITESGDGPIDNGDGEVGI